MILAAILRYGGACRSSFALYPETKDRIIDERIKVMDWNSFLGDLTNFI